MECIELNWLCKHTKKVRSSEAASTELSKTQFFPVNLVNNIEIRNGIAYGLDYLQCYNK